MTWRQGARRAARPGRSAAPPFAVLALAALALHHAAGCEVLDPLSAGCGNGVLDPGEDCDGNFPGQAVPCRDPAASQPDSCRFDCSDGGACPAGFGCGADGVCRRPTGTFGPSVGPLGGRTSDIVVSDVDADGRDDLVHAGLEGLVGLYFFDDDAEVEQEIGLPSFTAPALGDLTGDGVIDLAMPVRDGPQRGRIIVLLGVGDRELAAQSYDILQSSSQYTTHVEIVNALGPSFRDELLVFSETVMVGLEPGGSGSAQLQLLSYEDLAGLAFGDYVGGVDSPCEDLAAAEVGGTSLLLMTPCRGPGGTTWNGLPALEQLKLPSVMLPGVVRPAVVLPSGQRFGTGVLAARIDEDGLTDLVVPLESGALAVAYGAGSGAFVSATGTPQQATPYPETAFYAAPCQAMVTPGFPLAAGELEGGSSSFLVATDGIYVAMAGAGGPSFGAALCFARSWVEAVVGDFNGDGRDDVAAVDDETPAIDYFAGAGDGAFTFRVVPTPGRAQRLRVADVDGDLIDDLVLTVLASGEGEDLTISYGTPLVGLSTPSTVATFTDVLQVATGRILGDDAAEDVFVLSGSGETNVTAALYGSTDRFLQAPYLLQLGDEDPRALVASTGRFADLARTELVVLSRSTATETSSAEPHRLWLLRFDEEGRIEALPGPPLENDAPATPRLAVVDVEGDGQHEVVLLSDTELVVHRWQGAFFEAEAPVVFDPPLGLSGAGVLGVEDVDGDGKDDLYFVTDDGAALVLWNDGGFDASSALTLAGDGSLSGVTPGLEGAGQLRAITSINLDGDEGGDLVVTSDGGAYHVELAGRELATAAMLDGIAGGRAVRAADVDGDGVDDLVVGTSVGFRVYPGVPREPGS